MYFRTIKERQDWINASNDNAVTFAIVFNPRGAYEVIQATWPGEFPLIEQGGESSDYWKNRMHDFVMQKAQLTANPGQLVTDFMHAVPAIVTAKFNSHDTFLIK